MAHTSASSSSRTRTRSTGLTGSNYNKEDAYDLMVVGLRNAHGLEQQAIEMLERNVERLEHYPELRKRLSQHLTETRHQQERIERMLNKLDESTSTVKDTVMGMVQNMQAMVHAMANDEVLKNSFTGYAFEHFEIAAYTALGVMARAAGEEEVARLADEICEEERAMADWLEEHLPDVVEEHIMLMAKGEQKN
jgi:ferritin-like metal-binding protein YciE